MKSRAKLYKQLVEYWSPVAYVVSSEAYKQNGKWYRQVRINCPLCGAQHLHGADVLERGYLGDRVRHCSSEIKTNRGRTGYQAWARDEAPSGYYIWDDTPLLPIEQRMKEAAK